MLARNVRVVIVAGLALMAEMSAGGVATPGMPHDGRAGASARLEIVLPDDPTPVARTAAEELRAGIRNMTGREAAVVGESVARGGAVRFYVGATRAAAAAFSGAWKPDEVAVRSVPSGVILTGEATRGPIYAVDTYLEEICGVRWWTAEEAAYPARAELPVAGLDLRHAPPFRYRETYYLGALDPIFKVRLKGNFTSRTKYQRTQPARIPAAWGGDSTLHYFEKRASAYHSVLQILPPAKYFRAHPDWYALEPDGRAPHQLCLTHPEMRRAFIAELDALLSAHPETDFIQVSQEDKPVTCACAACRAVVAEEGAVSGLYLRFVNAVAAALESRHPRVTFDTFAYRFTRTPPRLARPRHNVTVRLCDIECAFNAPLDSFPGNRGFLEDLAGWSRIASGRLYIWDYATDFTCCLLPHPNLSTYAPNLRLFARSGALGVFEQGDSVCRAGCLAPFRAWYLAHLLWNPQRDERKLRDDFLAGYYGPRAAPHLAAYLAWFDRGARSSAARGVAVPCYHTNVTDFWTKDDALAACAALDAAFEAARGDGDAYARRVDRERLTTRLVKLLNWRAWQLGDEAARRALFTTWHAACRAQGVKAYREAYGAADFEACAAGVRRGLEPNAAKAIVRKPKAPGKDGFVWPKPFPTRNLQVHSSFEVGVAPHAVVPAGAAASDATCAWHGRRSLKLAGAAELVLAETEVAGEPGPFTVSAYVRSARPTRVRLGVRRTQADAVGSAHLARSQDFAVGTGWTRVALSGIAVAAPLSGFAVTLASGSNAVVWVDAVQVESGAATAYAPAAPIEATFAGNAALRACTYYADAQDVRFDTSCGSIALTIEPGTVAEKRLDVSCKVPPDGTFVTATHGVSGVVAGGL